MCGALDDWGVRHAGLCTFPHSAMHVWTYGKFGFHPRFLTAIMLACGPHKRVASQRLRPVVTLLGTV